MGSFVVFFYRKSIALLTCYNHIIIINKWLSGKAENIDPYCLFSTISLYFPLKLSWKMLWLCKTPLYLNQTFDFKSYIKYLICNRHIKEERNLDFETKWANAGQPLLDFNYKKISTLKIWTSSIIYITIGPWATSLTWGTKAW